LKYLGDQVNNTGLLNRFSSAHDGEAFKVFYFSRSCKTKIMLLKLLDSQLQRGK